MTYKRKKKYKLPKQSGNMGTVNGFLWAKFKSYVIFVESQLPLKY